MVRNSPLTPEASQILQQAEAQRKAKARGRLLAKKRSDLKRMALNGKDALRAIAKGKWCLG